LAPRFETLDSVKGALPAGTTLLGICGARVASYMIAGKCTRDQALARLPITTRASC
jgi:uroporphyrinogen decarboxylase